MSVIVIGHGLLGSEIVKQTNWSYISRKDNGIEFTDPLTYLSLIKPYNTVINCVAITNTYGTNKEEYKNINYKAVTKLSDICKQNHQKLIHISTDYVYAKSVNNATEEDIPIPSNNWYTYYKLLADEYILLNNNNYLICRCSFKPNPFPYDSAWIDQVGNFDYVNIIAKLIIKLINKNASGIYNVGTNLKTIFDLAVQTKPNVKPTHRPSHVPSDISMDINKLKSKLHGYEEN